MIAMSIMAVALASAAICLRMGLVEYDTARSTNYATQIMQNEAERLRLLSWSEIDDLPRRSRFASSDNKEDKYRFRRVIEDYEDLDDIKRVWLLAEWRGLGGESRELRLIFNYAKNGAYDYYYGAES